MLSAISSQCAPLLGSLSHREKPAAAYDQDVRPASHA